MLQGLRSGLICQTRSIQSGEKNVQIILVVWGVVILFSSAQSAKIIPSFTSKQTTPVPGSTDERG